MFSDLSAGRFTSAVSDRIHGPRVFRRRTPIIFMTGGNDTAITGFNSARFILDHLTSDDPITFEPRYRVYQPSVPGMLGNPTSVVRIGDASTYARANALDVPPVLIGVSNGAACAMSYARENDVSGLVLILPPIDVDYMYQNNTFGLRSFVGTAWGVTHPTPLPEDALPLEWAADLSDVPMQIWYAEDDPVSVGAGEAMNDFLGQVSNTTAYNVGELSHSDAAVLEVDENLVLSFIKSL